MKDSYCSNLDSSVKKIKPYKLDNRSPDEKRIGMFENGL